MWEIKPFLSLKSVYFCVFIHCFLEASNMKVNFAENQNEKKIDFINKNMNI